MNNFKLIDGSYRFVMIDDFGLLHDHVLGPLFDNGPDAERFLTAIEPLVFGSENFAKRNQFASMTRRVALYFIATEVRSMPNSEAEWQSAIAKIYDYHLVGYPYRSKPNTREAQWRHVIRPILEYLRDVKKLIPKGVVVPTTNRVRADSASGL